jgi:hypothetical protein
MRSVLIVALVGPGYSAKPLMDAFLSNGFNECHVFDYQLNRFEFGKEMMQQQLIRMAEQLKPDMIWMQIQGSDVIDLETFQAIQRIAFTVNFTFDIRINEQTQWLYNLVPHIGLVCFSNQEDVDECIRRGYKNCMVLQSSADSDVYKPAGIMRKGIVFVGNNFCNTNMEFPLSKERVAMVNFLQQEFPDDFKVYGNNWDGSKLISQKEEVAIYQSAAIVINQNNFDRTLYTSDRIWRAMMCGALCLTKYFCGIEKMFTRHLHLDWWHTLEELKQKINYYLSDLGKAALIGQSIGVQHVLDNHTWTARVKEMMAFIENLQPAIVDERNACIRAGGHVINGVIPGLGGDEDVKYKGMPCDCGKLRGDWYLCDCGNKQYQFRWVENI